MAKKIILSIVIFLVALVPIMYFTRDAPAEFARYEQVTVSIGDTDIESYVADSREKQILGLSGQESLEDGTGMLFVYQQPSQVGIWMKDMLIAIDIIWVNEDDEITHIERNVSPDTYPTIFDSSEKSLYVIETPAGYTAKNGIEVGDSITIN